MGDLLSAAADLLLGAVCPACGSPTLSVCRRCQGLLEQAPLRVPTRLEIPVWAAGQYRPLLAQIIPSYKDDGGLHLDRYLGSLLAKAVLVQAYPSDTQLVPIPSLAARSRVRGFDHARRLASIAAKGSGFRSRRVLSRVSGRDQRGLGRMARAANQTRSMRSRSGAGRVVIVDDVLTTGATLVEAHRALSVAGWSVLGAAVVAYTDNSKTPGVKG